MGCDWSGIVLKTVIGHCIVTKAGIGQLFIDFDARCVVARMERKHLSAQKHKMRLFVACL